MDSVFKGVDLTVDSECLRSVASLIPKAPPSIHSKVRIACLITYEQENSEVGCVSGLNSETWLLGGSVSAEKAAASKLREIYYKRVRRIYVVAQGVQFVPPGLQSREFLYEVAQGSTSVVMAGTRSLDNPTSSTLVMLYPFPPLFRKTARDEILEVSENFSRTAQKMGSVPGFKEHADWVELFNLAKEATANDSLDIYPVKLAAGVLLNNGEKRIASQTKSVDFESTIDPVTKLIPWIEEKQSEPIRVHAKVDGQATNHSSDSSDSSDSNSSEERTTSQNGGSSASSSQVSGVAPVLIIMTDQFGILHAPFASARSYLFESGFFDTKVVVHNRQGCLQKTTATRLAPHMRTRKLSLGLLPDASSNGGRKKKKKKPKKSTSLPLSPKVARKTKRSRSSSSNPNVHSKTKGSQTKLQAPS